MRAAPAVLLLVACATAPSSPPPAVAAAPPAPPARVPVQAPAPHDEPLGAAAARIAGPAAGVAAACDDAMARARAGLAAIRAATPPREVVATLRAYDDALAALNDVDAQAELARNASPDPDVRKAAEACDRQVQALLTQTAQDRAVYDALSALDLGGEDAATRFWMKRELREFRRSGVDRDEATRERIRKLDDALVEAGQTFDRNINDGTRRVSFAPAALAGLPADYVKAHPPGKDGKVVLTTDYPDYFPFMTYARRPEARRELWMAFNTRAAPANVEVLSRILELRWERARLLGYASWADFATENKMIGTGQAASEFVDRIAAAARARAAQEMAVLLARKQKDVRGAKALDPWDAGFYADRVKAEQYRFDAQAARPYFETGRVIQGVLDVTGRLLDLSYRPVEGARTWHGDVRTYDVVAGPSFGPRGGQVIGRIYLDLHPREGKYKHAAQFTLVSGQAGRRLPEGALLCNFPRPGGDGPALMEYSDVTTLFHEFGHLVHHVLGGNTRWAANSGVRTEWDFVEAPSQMLEEWARDRGVLQGFARHVKTGEPIPARMVEQLRAANEFGKAVGVRRQMFLAATSLHLHDRDPHGLDTTAAVADLQTRYSPYPYVPGTYFQASFGHLNGYSAAYYTYMWSLVIAKDLFSAFPEKDLFDPATAARYRRSVLEPGGGAPAAELVTAFLGRPYGFAAYEAWLAR
ncbi:MAG: M3 family metallopeptidase [Anaeromyxobacter sp.]